MPITPALIATVYTLAILCAYVLWRLTWGRDAAQEPHIRPVEARDASAGQETAADAQGPSAGRYDDRPHRWPGPVLPEEELRMTLLGRPLAFWESEMLRAALEKSTERIDDGFLLPDAALAGLARHEAADWTGWHAYRRAAEGEDTQAARPWPETEERG